MVVRIDKSILHGKNEKNLALFIIISFVLLAVTAYLSTVNSVQSFEKSVLETTTGLRFPILDSVMKFVSSFGDSASAIITFLVFGVALFIRGFKREFALSFLIWVGPLLSWWLKEIIARSRPSEFLLEGYSLPNDFGFPSGHVVFYVVFFGLIALYSKYLPNLSTFGRKLLLFTSIALISLVGISRIYLGVHWPTDVIAGYWLGFAILGVITFLYLKLGVVQKG